MKINYYVNWKLTPDDEGPAPENVIYTIPWYPHQRETAVADILDIDADKKIDKGGEKTEKLIREINLWFVIIKIIQLKS